MRAEENCLLDEPAVINDLCVFCRCPLEAVPAQRFWLTFSGVGLHYDCVDKLADVVANLREAPVLGMKEEEELQL